MDSLGRQAGGGRYAVPRQHWPDRSAGRRLTADPAVDSRQTAAAAEGDGGDSGARRKHHDRPGEAIQLLPAGVDELSAWFQKFVHVLRERLLTRAARIGAAPVRERSSRNTRVY